jgi:hypothetical protein
MFLGLYMLLPLLYVLAKKKSLGLKDSALPLVITTFATLALFMVWLFVPHMGLIGSITKLNLVPQNRLIIGLGLLNTLALIIFVYIYSKSRSKLRWLPVLLFAFAMFLGTYLVNKLIQHQSPGFVGNLRAIAYSLPMALSVILFLRKRFEAGMIVFALFVMLSSISVNPLYRGLGSITDNPLYIAILKYKDMESKWAIDDVRFENFALMAGKKTMSGVFFYPQKELWKEIDEGKSEYLYNRYAHVSYIFDTNQEVNVATGFVKTGPDQLVIDSELCSEFTKSSGIRQVVSSVIFSRSDQTCIKNIEIVRVNKAVFYIYKLAL